MPERLYLPGGSIPWLDESPTFPPLKQALKYPNGLLAIGGDLSAARLIAAYRRGIFPWFSPGEPILWWSPDPRMVLVPDQIKISRSFAKVLRNSDYQVRLDTAFGDVISACANTPRAGQDGTWISAEMQQAYRHLHQLGYAHSVEVWQQGTLTGGLYGVALGRIFFGESMFSHRSNASKIALAHLCHFLKKRDFCVIDCQMETAHLVSMGAAAIPRPSFAALLDRYADVSPPTEARWPTDGVSGIFRNS